MNIVLSAFGFSRFALQNMPMRAEVSFAEGITRQRLLRRIKAHSTARRMSTRKCCAENPFDHSTLIQRIGGQRIRCSRQYQSKYYNEKTELSELDCKNEQWYPVYRFHGLPLYALISRFKILQTVSSVLIMPFCYYSYLNEKIDGTMLALMSGAAIIAPLFFIIFTSYFNRIIGVISINEARTIIRVGHLSFYGGRQNTFIPVEDVVPLTETSENPRHYFVKIRRYSTNKQPLILSTRKVELCDMQASKSIFGSNDFFVEQGAYVSDMEHESMPVSTDQKPITKTPSAKISIASDSDIDDDKMLVNSSQSSLDQKQREKHI